MTTTQHPAQDVSDSAIALLPCPFCGGEAYEDVVAPHTHTIATFMPDYEGGAMVCCSKCHAANWREGANGLELAIAAWNARELQQAQGVGSVSCTANHPKDWPCAICTPQSSAPVVGERKPLTRAEIAKGWEEAFVTTNPFCPCDLKSFDKAVRWAESALTGRG